MNEILAFDVGIDIVGMIDLRTNSYFRYRGKGKVRGALRILDCVGIVISFNGTRYDLPELMKLTGLTDPASQRLRGTHYDMMVEASRDRWPPEPGTQPIAGTSLLKHWQHYFGDRLAQPPCGLDDEYELANWWDCYMAAELWREIVSKRESRSE